MNTREVIREIAPLVLTSAVLISGSVFSFHSATRNQIKEKYHHRCAQCGSTKHLECHHRVPESLSGKSTVENGVLLCGDKSNDCHEEWDRKALKQGIIYPGIPIQDAPHNLFKNENVRLKTLRRLGMK